MKSKENVAVVIQARLGSQRVPRKMIKPFAGTTLTDIAIKKVLDSKAIDRSQFYMSVYESELLDISAKHDVNVYLRSEQSANSEGTPLTEMYEWYSKHIY